MSLIKSDVLIDSTSKIFVEEINFSDHEEWCNSVELSHPEKIQRIIRFFGLEGKIASVNEAFNYLARKLLSNRNISKASCFAKESNGEYFRIFAEWEQGFLHIWRNGVDACGAFTENVIVRSKNECMFKPIFLTPESIKKEFKNYILDKNDVVWEILPDGSYAKEPNIDGAIRRYLKDENFGKVILSQMLKEIFSREFEIVYLLDSGLIFNGQKIYPKNYVNRSEYETLCRMARVSFNNDDSYFISSNMERDITPCLYWEE